jgi:hypothetical protein
VATKKASAPRPAPKPSSAKMPPGTKRAKTSGRMLKSSDKRSK